MESPQPGSNLQAFCVSDNQSSLLLAPPFHQLTCGLAAAQIVQKMCDPLELLWMTVFLKYATISS